MNWIIVLNNNFKRGFCKKSNFLVKFLIPIIVVMLGIAVNYVSNPSFGIGIVASEQTPKVKTTIETLKQTPGIEINNADPNMLNTDMILGKYNAVITFTGDDFKLSSIKDKEHLSHLEELVTRYMADPTPVDTSLLTEYQLSIAGRSTAFILLFLMITATITASLMIKDRHNGTFIRFLYAPQSVVTYIMGNIIYNFVIIYLQFFISMSMLKLLQIPIGIDYWDLLAMGLWIAAMATAFGTCIASLFKSELYAGLMSSCIVLILSLISGTFISFQNMPTGLKHISIISPWRWLIRTVVSMEQGSDWFSNIQHIWILTLFIVVFFLVALVKIKNTKDIGRV